MSDDGGGGDPRYLPVVLIPDSVVLQPSSSTGQLMVAMQPGVDLLPSVEVQEVVVVTDHRGSGDGDDHGGGGGYYYFDGGGGDARGLDGEIVEAEYDDGSESVAVEIEVVDARRSRSRGVPEEYYAVYAAPVGRRDERPRATTKARRGRLKRRGRFMRKSPVKTTMSKRRTFESSPEFNDSESDGAAEESGYGRASHKPRKRDFAHRLQWRDADMQAAMSAVRDKNMTIRGAAKQFSVPYSTLKDRVRNRVKHGTKPGVKTALSPEDEEELVRCIQQMESAGFQMHGINIREQAHELLNRNQLCSINSKHRTSAPGHNWLAGFLKRHPGIEIKRSINRPVTPSFSKQKHLIKRFFDAASSAYQKLHRSPQASQLYTMTEFKLSSFPHTSIILAAAANGTVLPPYVMFSGSRILAHGLQKYFPTAFFSVYSSANQRKYVLLSWFRDHFLRHAQQSSGGRPIVLFVSQPTCNISVHLIQLANDRQVTLVSMPMGILHLVQPLNNAVVREMDDLITIRGRRYLEDRKVPSVDQIGMAEILQKVWQKGLPSKEIVSNFRENGLFPFNIRAVTHEKITSTPIVDISRVEDMSSDNETNGLTLLSELSSLEHGDQCVGDAKNFDFNRKRSYSGDGGAEFSPFKRHHKLSAEDSDFGTSSFEQKISVDQINSDTGAPWLSEELMKHVLANDKKETSCSRTRPAPRFGRHRRRQDVQREILDSKTNPEQLELAIKSIVEESSKTPSAPRHHSRSVETDFQTFRISSGFHNSPAGQRTSKTYKSNPSKNSNNHTTDPRAAKFVTLTPVRHVFEVGPNVNQEYISYVEDPHAIQEEFVPQEIVEEQTIIQDCTTYRMPSNAFCKDQATEEFIEEVVDLPEFILSTGDVLAADRIKIENVDHEFLNNNELNYDLHAEVGGGVSSSNQERLSFKTLNIAEIDSDLCSNNADTTMFIEVNGRSYPVVQTLSVQEFRKTFGFVSQAAGLLLGDETEDVKDEN